MYSHYRDGVVRALTVSLFVIAVVLTATAAFAVVAPQGIAFAEESEPDWGSWGGDCCTDAPYSEPDWGSWGGECYDCGYDPNGNPDDGCYYDCGYDPNGNPVDDGCYDYYCGDDDGCDYYCGDDDYCCDDYDDDFGDDVFCDDYCDDEFYDEYEEGTSFRDSSGARYSFSAPSFRSSPTSYSAPIQVSNRPAPSYPSYPSYPSNPSRPSQTVHFPSSTNITNIDNSINDSFNTYNSYNTAIAQSTTGGAAVAAVTPGHTVAYVLPTYSYTAPTYTYTAPVVRATPAYVALSQIPYTGFDLGPVGNAIYWMSLLSFAVAGAYLLVYYNGGALALAGQAFAGMKSSRKEGEYTLPELPVAPVVKKEIASNTKDTMKFTEKGIVIDRNF